MTHGEKVKVSVPARLFLLQELGILVVLLSIVSLKYFYILTKQTRLSSGIITGAVLAANWTKVLALPTGLNSSFHWLSMETH